MRARLMALLAGMLLVAPAASVLPAHAEETNTAVAVNTKDGSSIFKVAFQIKKVMDGDVDSQNAAVAYSNCVDCQTVAVAIQIVLVVGDVDSATPTNVAIAYNENCTSCETMAAAYQYVYSTGDNFRFSKEGKRRLYDLRQRLRELRKHKEYTLEQVAAELERITTELAAVIEDELRPADTPAETTSTTDGSSSASTSTSTSTSTTSTTSETTP